MAFGMSGGADTIEVICSKDSAVKCDMDTYGKYLESLDESLLEMPEDAAPTRFVLKKTLPFGVVQRIKNQQLGYKDGEVQVQMGFTLEEVRCALVDVKGAGAGLEFKKEADGYASKTLIEKLESYGIVQELFTARQGAIKARGEISKKS